MVQHTGILEEYRWVPDRIMGIRSLLAWPATQSVNHLILLESPALQLPAAYQSVTLFYSTTICCYLLPAFVVVQTCRHASSRSPTVLCHSMQQLA